MILKLYFEDPCVFGMFSYMMMCWLHVISDMLVVVVYVGQRMS